MLPFEALQLSYICVYDFFANLHLLCSFTVAGTVTDFYQPTNSSSVLSWSPPNPPNGVILYYNIRITHLDSGDVVATADAFSNTTIDVSDYIDSNGEFSVEVCMYLTPEYIWDNGES